MISIYFQISDSEIVERCRYKKRVVFRKCSLAEWVKQKFPLVVEGLYAKPQATATYLNKIQLHNHGM